MSSYFYFKKAICLVFLLFSASWAETGKSEAWEKTRNQLSAEEQERLDLDLVTAAGNGELTLAQELIEQGADVNCGDYHPPQDSRKSLSSERSCKYTSLISAVKNKDLRMTQFLLDQGALLNLTVKDEKSEHCGLTAANFAQNNILHLLLKQRALFGMYPEFVSDSSGHTKLICHQELMNYQGYQEHEFRLFNTYNNR